jgi:proteasome lid subunit RPN8/RPN11
MHPEEQLNAFLHFEAQGWELVGIYHSHPQGPDSPSAADLAEAYYPESVYLIWSHHQGSWRCRGFQIRDLQFIEVELIVTFS